MTEILDEDDINRELGREIRNSIEAMLGSPGDAFLQYCASRDGRLAELHLALLHWYVCEAVDALASGASPVRLAVLTHQLRRERLAIGPEAPEN